MTTKDLITLLQLLDPDGTAQVLEESGSELRTLRSIDVHVLTDVNGDDIPCEDPIFSREVVIFKAWS